MNFVWGMLCGGVIVFVGGYFWLIWLFRDVYR